MVYMADNQCLVVQSLNFTTIYFPIIQTKLLFTHKFHPRHPADDIYLLCGDEVAGEDVDEEGDVDDELGGREERRVDGRLDVVTLTYPRDLLAGRYGGGLT